MGYASDQSIISPVEVDPHLERDLSGLLNWTVGRVWLCAAPNLFPPPIVFFFFYSFIA